ncbi:MAG: FAD-dependent oxidoreductase [Nocardioidaceae bacterium]|nr:FAD-dependent oxidoreductase [Nocardioidaceae bacterium]NUS51182.1 FAD-dependent oxidoreductase [Nocardioidaceae bacterium]
MPTPASPGRPLLLAAVADAGQLDRVESELQRSFGGDFRVRGELSTADATRTVEGAYERDEPVALVLVDDAYGDGARADLFELVRRLHPDARRALLVDWGAWADRGSAKAILHAMAVGHINYYVLKPWIQRDELFHRSVAEFVQEWSRSAVSNMREVVVVADPRSARAYAISSLLTRNGIPHAFRDRGSEMGREVLERTGAGRAEVAVWMPAVGGKTLVDPTDAEVVEAWGVPTTLPEGGRDFDVLVVGGGPAGLAAAVYASSEGLRVLVVERESIGGQAGSSSLIRNYLGFSRGVSGAELAQRGYQQAWVFGAHFVLTREVDELTSDGAGFVAHVGDVGTLRARAVVVATGVSYRRLGVDSLEALSGKGVYYGANVTAAHALTGLQAVVVGGGNSAGQAAVHLARYCEHVTVVVRGSSLAGSMSAYLVGAIDADPAISVRTEADVVAGEGEGRLERVTVRHRGTGTEDTLPADGLFVMIGAEPRTDWLPAAVERDDHGFLLTGSDAAARGWAIERRPHPYETTVPGVFAVGDVRCGSVKRVASAVGEGSVVVSQLHQLLATASHD